MSTPTVAHLARVLKHLKKAEGLGNMPAKAIAAIQEAIESIETTGIEIRD